MREMRSGSQILFGHLPEQTVDVAAGIWKVRNWIEPKIETAIDPGALRDELIRAAYPWSETGQDGGLVADLYANRQVRVKSLNKERGVWCEPFPRLYLCRRCMRLHDFPSGTCQCGATGRRGQLPFVGYHDACGAIKTPYVRKCPEHQQRAVRLPGTASATEIVFYCPVCQRTIHRGFGAACDCDQGGALKFTVHRSGTVFKPRSFVLINPPKRDILSQVESAGGGERALNWLLDGMTGRRLTDASGGASEDSVRKMLKDRGFDATTIEAMIAAMPKAKDAPKNSGNLLPLVREQAFFQARQIALATFESRKTVGDLLKTAATERQRVLYERSYADAFSEAGVERIDLVDRFPVLTGQFGYTRGDGAPGASRLRAYRETNGDYTVFGDLVETEALLIRLSPVHVHRWLRQKGHALGSADDPRQASVSVLESLNPTAARGPLSMDPATKDLTVLVHSFAHAFIKRCAVYAGIERSALSELVLPHTFSFFVYAAARGDFILGGLQALFETELHQLLHGLVADEFRCALDPACAENGSACAVCLHLGEPSCRMFNTLLSRKALAGGDGFFDLTAA